MPIKLTIDKAGRVVIPKPLRDALGLSPGDSLVADSAGREITLRPVDEAATLQQERGFWVYRTGRHLKDLSIAEWIERERADRAQRAV